MHLNIIATSISYLLLGFCSTIVAGEKVHRGLESVREGNHLKEALHVDFGDVECPSKIMDIVQRMPKLRTLVVAGPLYIDQHIEELVKIDSLRFLVLDSTGVSDKKIAEIRKARPELVVYQSQRWAIRKIGKLAYGIMIDDRLSNDHPDLRKLLGDQHFMEVTRVDFGRLPDIEMGPWERIPNEQLAPLRMLPTLTYLDLSWTRLDDCGMRYLEGLTRLEKLSIPLEEVSVEGLAPIRGMPRLKLFTGEMSDTKAKHLAGLRKLEFLNIGSPKLTDVGLKYLRDLKRLEYLRLNDSSIHGDGLRHLCELPRLESLFLDNSQLEDLTWVSRMSSLEHLSIDGTKIDDANVAHLAKLPNLRSLSLNDTQVSDAALAHLKKIPKLREIYLNYTKISNAGLRQIQEFANLEHLSIYGIVNDEEGIAILENFTNLNTLYFDLLIPGRDNYEKELLYDRIRKALPNCKINHY